MDAGEVFAALNDATGTSRRVRVTTNADRTVEGVVAYFGRDGRVVVGEQALDASEIAEVVPC